MRGGMGGDNVIGLGHVAGHVVAIGLLRRFGQSAKLCRAVLRGKMRSLVNNMLRQAQYIRLGKLARQQRHSLGQLLVWRVAQQTL